jgi:hypothetical protein
MSLINEALKKAQRQRSLDSAPLSAAPSGVAAAAVTTHVRAASHRRSHAPIWFGLGLLGLGVVTTALVMHYGFSPPEPAKPVSVASAPSVPPPSSPSVPPAAPLSTPPPPAPAPVVILPPIPQVAVNVAPLPSAGAPVTPSAPAATVVAPVQEPAATVGFAPTPVAPVAPAVPLTPAEREAQIYAFLNSIRLTGVRGLDREARVLMNERVWRLNDVVSPELGLRLSAVRPNLLVFTDTQGRTYDKPY